MSAATSIPQMLPGWMRRGWGAKLVGVIAGVLDTLSTSALQASTVSRLTLQDTPDDVLPLLGEERRLPAFPGEPPEYHRQRLIDAWDTHEFSGSSAAVAGQVDYLLGVANSAPERTAKTCRRDPMIHPISDTAWWSRFWLVVPWSVHGGALTADQKTTLCSSVRTWKSVRWRCDGVALIGQCPVVGDGHAVGDVGLTVCGEDSMSGGPGTEMLSV
jgi:hypothetical protein